MNRTCTLRTVLTLLLAVPVFCAGALADDIDFAFNHSCTIDTCPDGTPRNLTIPAKLGKPATDDIYIAFVNGIPVTDGGSGNGTLDFATAGATYVFLDGPDHTTAKFDKAGGFFTITGEVPGLSSPTTLLSGYFLAGGVGQTEKPGSAYFNSPVYITSADPTLLSDLGMANATPYGDGFLSDSFNAEGSPDQYWTWNVSLDFTPSPEPSSLMLFGSGVLGFGALLRKRFFG